MKYDDKFEYNQIITAIMKYSSSEQGSQNISAKKIDWNDYNYPCLVRIFHYDSEETPQVLVRKVRMLRINHILIIFVCLWNFINNIVDTAQGVDQGVLRIILSIFTALIFFPISLYLFYLPYRIYMKQEESACIFYILSVIVIVFFLIWSFADFADANGWVMFGRNATTGKGAAAFFAFFTALFSLIITILGSVNLVIFCRRDTSGE